MKTALYVHIPFCVKKCAYCDFVSLPNRLADAENYVSAVLREAEIYRGTEIDSVFIGGGTPSILPGEYTKRLFKGLQEIFAIEKGAEWTAECNPGTVSEDKFRLYREMGVNRLSFGAQASQKAILQTLGRIHTWGEVEEAVFLAREAGFASINLDLMYALPGQDMEMWLETLEKAVEMRVPHISAYSLILEEGTPLTRRVERGEVSVPEEDTVVQMQHEAQEYLEKQGYSRYEISNYAKEGYACLHNMRYWTRAPYIGLGCAAHSFYGNERYSNTADLSAYIAGEKPVDRQYITPEEALEETVMLGTRTARGIDLEEIQHTYGTDLYGRTQKLCNEGLGQIKEGRFACTREGMDVQNAVVLYLLTGK